MGLIPAVAADLLVLRLTAACFFWNIKRFTTLPVSFSAVRVGFVFWVFFFGGVFVVALKPTAHRLSLDAAKLFSGNSVASGCTES